MFTTDFRLKNIENELNAKGITAHYLKIDHKLALRVWDGKNTFRELLPEHKVSGDYFIVNLDYAYQTLCLQESVA